MKIVTDQNLINHRIALQDVLVDQVSEFADYIEKFRVMIIEIVGIENELAQSMRSKISSIAISYFELQYGNFFYKQSNEFRNAVINKVVAQFINLVKTTKITELGNYALGSIFVFLEEALEEEIKKLNNGK
jgi:hypothetical protein